MFGALDLTSGYHQIELTEEDRDLTTFTLPFGRYRYEVLPMGLMPSSDIFNMRSDQALQGLQATLKSVDDFLTTARNWGELRGRMNDLFQRFRDLNIKIKPSKLRLGTRVKFGGFQVEAVNGEVKIMPDPGRLKAIEDLPAPSTKTEVRAFLGMARQMEAWSPDLSFSSSNLRKRTIKDTAFTWDDKCEEEFQQIKKLIRDLHHISPFEKGLPLQLYTDASKEGGLAYILAQAREDGTKAIIQCGSTSLNEAQTHYSIMEVELLAVV